MHARSSRDRDTCIIILGRRLRVRDEDGGLHAVHGRLRGNRHARRHVRDTRRTRQWHLHTHGWLVQCIARFKLGCKGHGLTLHVDWRLRWHGNRAAVLLQTAQLDTVTSCKPYSIRQH